MSNTIKVPHTIQFLAEIDIDKVPANLLPLLLSLSEEQLTDMIKDTTLHAIEHAQLIEQSNEGYNWAYLSLAE